MDIHSAKPNVSEYAARARAVAIVERVMFFEPWKACRRWIGVNWSERTYPRPKLELMAADENEALEWLKERVPSRLGVDRPAHYEFERRGVLAGVGIYEAKRILGF